VEQTAKVVILNASHSTNAENTYLMLCDRRTVSQESVKSQELG